MTDEIRKDASPADLRNARRLTDLKVNEVSVVDRPAIRRTFLILKRHLEEGMEDNETGIEKSELEQAAEIVAKTLAECGFSLEKGLPEEMQKGFGAIVPWLRRMAKQAEGETRVQILQAAAFLDSAQRKAKPEENMTDKNKATETEAERKAREAKEAEEEEKKKAAAKEAEEDEKKGKGKDKAKMPPPFGGGGGGGGAGTDDDEEEMKGKKQQKQKALSLDGDAIVKFDDNDQLHIVAKGRKMLTDERKDTLKSTAGQLLGMLKEADEEMFKSAVFDLIKELPKDTKVPSMVRPSGVGGVPSMSVSKAEADEKDAKIEALEKRLEAIEKSRAPSASIEDDGNGDKPTEVKKSMWSGVL